jgi:hypothetical protein
VNIGVFVEALDVVPLDHLGPFEKDSVAEEPKEHVEADAVTTPTR